VAQNFDNLPLSVRKSPDGTEYVYGVTLYGRLFRVGGFPASGFEQDLTEAADQAGEVAEFPPTETSRQ
jgi:hypothetical protein